MHKLQAASLPILAAALFGCAQPPASKVTFVDAPASAPHYVPPAATREAPPSPAAATAPLEKDGVHRASQPAVILQEGPRPKVRAVPELSPFDTAPYRPGYGPRAGAGYPPPPDYAPPPAPYYYGAPPAESRSSPIAGPLAGGAIGGLIGSQFGGGSGRYAATAIGAATGAMLGNRSEDPCQPGVNGGTIAGTVLGGVFGNAFGKGSGRTAMTAIGAGTGAVLGTRIAGSSQCQ